MPGWNANGLRRGDNGGQSWAYIWIPNNEIRNVMETAVTDSDWTKVIEQLQKSRAFMDAIQRADSAETARIIENIHNDIFVPIHYNFEGDLTAITASCHGSFHPVADMLISC